MEELDALVQAHADPQIAGSVGVWAESEVEGCSANGEFYSALSVITPR